MELVYLWVEKYKNIHNQGFSFSSKFDCNYDGENLTIKPKEHVENFFGENINVTAIVGKNGSGKSSILKLLHKALLVWKGKGFAIFINEKNEKFYLCGVENYPFLAEKYQPLYSEGRIISFPFFEYSFTYDRDLEYDNEFIYPKKQINAAKGVIGLTRELLRNQKNILLNYFDLKEKKQLDKFESFFIPKTINIFFDTKTIKSNKRFPKLTDDKERKLAELKNSITNNIITIDFIEKTKLIRELLSNKNSYEEPSNQFDLFHPFEFQLGNTDTLEEYTNLWSNSFQANNVDINVLSEIKTIQSIGTNDEWINESDFKIYSFDIDNLNSNAIEVIMNSFSSNQFTIQLCDTNNKSLNDLSFGEQQLLFILNQMYSLKKNQITVMENIIYEDNEQEEIETDKNIESYIVLLDEVDIGFHPMWQKKSISYICDFLKLLPNINFHLVFATHSPFILSDLPKENVIFLEKYEDKDDEVKNGNQKVGNCKNVTKETKIDTFGANIHTLLSHGFFMKDGLMGEFAKSKINDVYDFLSNPNTQTNLTQIKAQEIINLIGEPILKKELQYLYDYKFETSEIDRQIREHQEAIERLQAQRSRND